MTAAPSSHRLARSETEHRQTQRPGLGPQPGRAGAAATEHDHPAGWPEEFRQTIGSFRGAGGQGDEQAVPDLTRRSGQKASTVMSTPSGDEEKGV